MAVTKALLCLFVFFFAVSSVQSESLESILNGKGLTTFAGYLQLAGENTTASISNATIFVPTNDAFTAKPVPFSDLQATMQYHFLPGMHMLLELGNNQYASLGGQNVRTQVVQYPGMAAPVYYANGQHIAEGDLVSAEQNVVVHVLSGVMYPIPTQTIGQMLNGEPSLNFTAHIVAQLQEVVNILNDEGRNLTFFAPTDDIWASIDPQILHAIDDPTLVDHIMKYHIVPDVIFSDYFPAPSEYNVSTLAGSTLRVIVSPEGAITVNGASLSAVNALGTNGVYHSISGVLIPHFSVADDLIFSNFSSFYAKINSTEAFQTLSNLSLETPLEVFALPNSVVDAAGDALTPAVLAYHFAFENPATPASAFEPVILTALDGNPIFGSSDGTIHLVNGIPLTQIDEAANGRLYSIETPLKPPTGTVLTTLQEYADISGFYSFASLALPEFLSNTSATPFTLFAPSNDALAKHPGLVGQLTSGDTELAMQVLNLHIASGAVFSQLVGAASTPIATLGGESVALSNGESGFLVAGAQNQAKIVQGDIVGTNGVIHIVDDVLLPAGYVEPTSGPTEEPTTVPPTTEEPTTAAPTTAAPTTAAPTTAAPTTAAPTTAAPTTAAPTTAATTTTTTTTTTTKNSASLASPLAFVFLALFKLFF